MFGRDKVDKIGRVNSVDIFHLPPAYSIPINTNLFYKLNIVDMYLLYNVYSLIENAIHFIWIATLPLAMTNSYKSFFHLFIKLIASIGVISLIFNSLISFSISLSFIISSLALLYKGNISEDLFNSILSN